MPEPAQPPSVAAEIRRIDADTVYAALGDPTRRRLIQILSDGKPRTATQLAPSANRRLDATLKHLVALRGAGIVVTEPNPADGRRQLYRLAPSIPVSQTASGREIDFGYCVVRCGA